MSNSSFSGWDFAEIIKKTVTNGLSFIPGPGPLLSSLATIFWPAQKPDVWAEFAEKIAGLIDTKIMESINGLLSGDIAQIQARMETVSGLMSSDLGSPETRSAYNNLAEDMDGLDKKFMAFSDEINHQILPLLSITALLQITYWITGLERSSEIGLSDTDIKKLRGLVSRAKTRVDAHVSKLYDNVLTKALLDSDATTVANNVMAAHGYYRLHGMEYIELTDKLVKSESLAKKQSVHTISYSTFFGRQTANARLQALKPESMMPPPLKPTLTNTQAFNKIASITGLQVDIGGVPRVGGITVVFESGDAYTMGKGRTAGTFEIGESEITSLEVWGRNAVDKMTFTLTDGRTFSIGERGADIYEKLYAGSAHAIAGIYLSNDAPALAGQAAAIAVSYRMISD